MAGGGAWLDPAVTGRVLAAYRATARDGIGPERTLSALTPRELEVLRLIGRGCSNQEIAELLVISEATVKSHVCDSLRRLGLRYRAAVMVLLVDRWPWHPAQ